MMGLLLSIFIFKDKFETHHTMSILFFRLKLLLSIFILKDKF